MPVVANRIAMYFVYGLATACHGYPTSEIALDPSCLISCNTRDVPDNFVFLNRTVHLLAAPIMAPGLWTGRRNR
jgi:hypothetical protein